MADLVNGYLDYYNILGKLNICTGQDSDYLMEKYMWPILRINRSSIFFLIESKGKCVPYEGDASLVFVNTDKAYFILDNIIVGLVAWRVSSYYHSTFFRLL